MYNHPHQPASVKKKLALGRSKVQGVHQNLMSNAYLSLPYESWRWTWSPADQRTFWRESAANHSACSLDNCTTVTGTGTLYQYAAWLYSKQTRLILTLPPWFGCTTSIAAWLSRTYLDHRSWRGPRTKVATRDSSPSRRARPTRRNAQHDISKEVFVRR